VIGFIEWGRQDPLFWGIDIGLWVAVLMPRWAARRRRRRPLEGAKVLTGVSPFAPKGVLTVGGKTNYRYRRQTATSVVLMPMRPWHHVARSVHRCRFRIRHRIYRWIYR